MEQLVYAGVDLLIYAGLVWCIVMFFRGAKDRTKEDNNTPNSGD